MTDEEKRRTEALQQAAACRQRAVQYDVLSLEAKNRGDIELCSKFASCAYEERAEAQRLEESATKVGE